jgi:poly-gamma-glutamate capsule biosynthesis protein CapA/YwtB (metallophosphatase superfamily)
VGERLVTVFLGGDVMTGRGVDQILPHPGDPRLREPYVRDARGYVRLAERASGPIPWPVDFAWPWGDALPLMDEMRPDVRLVNVETSVTGGGDPDVGKGLHYRMNPRNVPCLTAAGLDVCALANNHVLDFGRRGLADTLATLAGTGITTVGAGGRARQPAVMPVAGGHRVVVFSLGTPSSGIPPDWATGVALLPDLSDATADELIARVLRVKRPGDVVVASIHWGANWGYEVPRAQINFAHRILDGGVDMVHGHSSHHPRPVEVHRGKLVLYGCGDLVDDYEGISGYEQYRDDLRLLYFATVHPNTGDLVRLRMVPMRTHRMRLRHTNRADTGHVHQVLDTISRPFGSRIDLTSDRTLEPRLA